MPSWIALLDAMSAFAPLIASAVDTDSVLMLVRTRLTTGRRRATNTMTASSTIPLRGGSRKPGRVLPQPVVPIRATSQVCLLIMSVPGDKGYNDYASYYTHALFFLIMYGACPGEPAR